MSLGGRIFEGLVARCFLLFCFGTRLLAAGLQLANPSFLEDPGVEVARGIANKGTPMVVPFRCSAEEMAEVGLHCLPEDPCDVYLELSEVAEIPKSHSVLVAGNLHTTNITVSSILLVSFDSGKNWLEPFERIPHGVLRQVQFVDHQHGWISGHLLLDSPKSPFFLITRDGGHSWELKPVGPENKTGIIERFVFQSPDEGLAWIDRLYSTEGEPRYELYETRTGGASWILLEVSDRPIRRRIQFPEKVSEWRIRVDDQLPSYVVEKKHNESWVAIAEFQISVASCSFGPEAFELGEPPQPKAVPVEPASPVRRSPTLRR